MSRQPHREPTTVGLAVFAIGGTITIIAAFVCIAGALWYHSLANPVTTPAFGVLVGSEVLWVGALVFGAKKPQPLGGDDE